MSIVRNTAVLRNAALGALVVLALFECNGFVAVRFGINMAVATFEATEAVASVVFTTDA